MALDYNEVFRFMREYGIDVLNRFGELIIDMPTNTFTTLNDCESIEEVQLRVVYSICRPIAKGLEEKDAHRLLKRFNAYFKTELTREDFYMMYRDFCSESTLPAFREFMRRGFPVAELKRGQT